MSRIRKYSIWQILNDKIMSRSLQVYPLCTECVLTIADMFSKWKMYYDISNVVILSTRMYLFEYYNIFLIDVEYYTQKIWHRKVTIKQARKPRSKYIWQMENYYLSWIKSNEMLYGFIMVRSIIFWLHNNLKGV